LICRKENHRKNRYERVTASKSQQDGKYEQREMVTGGPALKDAWWNAQDGERVGAHTRILYDNHDYVAWREKNLW
jgi:hypothetical protein